MNLVLAVEFDTTTIEINVFICCLVVYKAGNVQAGVPAFAKPAGSGKQCNGIIINNRRSRLTVDEIDRKGGLVLSGSDSMALDKAE